MTQLSIITVTYNSAKQLPALIDSVKKGASNISYEHIFVDNASSDATRAILSALPAPNRSILNNANEGFAAANTAGYRQARGNYILFLNPDMELEAGCLDRLVSWMDAHPQTAIAGSLLLNDNGDINIEAAPRRFPTIGEQLMLLLKLDKLFPSALDRYFYRDIDLLQEQDVESVRGSFMCMRRSFIDSCGWPFDPRYFIWFEDVDICREAAQRGFAVTHVPTVRCKDAIGQSFRQRKRTWRFRQYAKSLTIYFDKWGPRHAAWCARYLYTPLAYLIGSKAIEMINILCAQSLHML